MPVVQTTAYSPASEAADLVRALANDQNGSLFNDTFLLPYLNAAYREVQLYLANVGKQVFTADYTILTVPAVATADPGQEVQIGFTGTFGNVPGAPLSTPALPSTFLEPYEISERQNGSTDMFQGMQNLTSHGGLPSLPQEGQLRFWEWREDSLNFLGATQAIDIKIRFKKGFAVFSVMPATGLVNTSGNIVTLSSGTNFVTGNSWNYQPITINSTPYTILQVTDASHLTLTASAGSQTNSPYTGPSSIGGSIQILNSLNAVAYIAAALALKPRGSPLADGYAAAGDEFKDKLVNEEARTQQHSVYRRKGFSHRYGHGPFSW